VSAAPGCEFPNPCPVCGANDDHAQWRTAATATPGWMYGATHCPHPAERGHGTGCCCGGISRETQKRQIQESLFRPSLEQRMTALPSLLDPETVRALLRESVTVVKPGEVLFFTVADPNITPNQLREIQEMTDWWLERNAPEFRVMVLMAGEMAVAEPAQG
jgi:hypothetical protein